jgi:cellulose synthase A
MSYGRCGDARLFNAVPNVPLLTNGQMVDDILPEPHAFMPSYMAGGGGSGGKSIHSLLFTDSSFLGA